MSQAELAEKININRALRQRQMGHEPFCLWFTGLSGAGKTTTAALLEETLLARGLHTFLLDGDNVRQGLCRDLGFSDAARAENIRRAAEVAKLMFEAGIVTLVTFISPFRAERQLARELFPEGSFLELHMATPLETCEARDPKGLYRKARAGEVPQFTGISSPYEAPEAPELALDATNHSTAELVQQICRHLEAEGLLPLPQAALRSVR